MSRCTKLRRAGDFIRAELIGPGGFDPGPAGATVSALGLGCAALATTSNPDAVVKAALDAGMDFFDTSDL